jgi:CRISPR-associated exonuclease Cas4
MVSEIMEIGGTLVQSASVCSRQLWLESRKIAQDQENDALMIGRLIDRESYGRDKKSVPFGPNRFDVLRKEGETLVVGEVKKSSHSIEAARMQLCHYLYELTKTGVDAKGVLLVPREKRREEVILTEEAIEKLEELYRYIREICGEPSPPSAQWGRFCRGCAYAEFCWS